MTELGERGCCEFPVNQLICTFHMLYNLPREMLQLDPQEELLEVVICPVVSYDYKERRLTRIPLNEHVMQFSLSSIVFKDGLLVMDAEKMNAPDTRGKYAQQWLSTSQTTATEAEKGKTKNKTWSKGKENNTDNNDMAHKNHGGRNNNNSSSGSGSSGATNNDGCRSKNNNDNTLLLQWPCPAGLTAHIDVTVGVRRRKKGSSAVRWISNRLDDYGSTSSVGLFSVAVDEVYRKKHIPRVVGLSVGGAIFSFAVSPTDVRERIVGRLLDDKTRFCAAARNKKLEEIDVVSMLRSGFSEEEIYRHMLLLADPHYYRRRLQNTLTLYKSNSSDNNNNNKKKKKDKSAELWQCDVLLEKYASHEEELMRRVAVEVGPECQSVSLRQRLLAFREKHLLTEQRVFNCLQLAIGEKIYDKLINEPEEIFEIMKKEFGEEPLPTSYLFSAQNYKPEKRTFFFDTLCGGRKEEEEQDAAVSFWGLRPPFTVSPCEEALHVNSSTSRPGEHVSEVEALREKYATEFAQIIPFIVGALQTVVEKNQTLCGDGSANGIFAVFKQHNGESHIVLRDIVERAAQHTFISPSSMLGAFIYLDRLSLLYPELVISKMNIFRLFVTSVRVASKVLELRSVNNAYFAEVFGLDMKSMNLLEEVFVKHLRFNLFLSSVEFQEYASALRAVNVHQQTAFLPQGGQQMESGKNVSKEGGASIDGGCGGSVTNACDENSDCKQMSA